MPPLLSWRLSPPKTTLVLFALAPSSEKPKGSSMRLSPSRFFNPAPKTENHMSYGKKEHQAEMCASMHEAIAEGRTAVLPVAGIWSHEQKAFVMLFRCPRCAGPIHSVVK